MLLKEREIFNLQNFNFMNNQIIYFKQFYDDNQFKICKNCLSQYEIGKDKDCHYHKGDIKFYSCILCGDDQYYNCCKKC